MDLPNLRHQRLRRAITQAQLAEMSGVAEPTINRIERGQKARLSTVQKLAKAFGVEPHELMEEAPPARRRAPRRKAQEDEQRPAA